jgi:hypothetical protein
MTAMWFRGVDKLGVAMSASQSSEMSGPGRVLSIADAVADGRLSGGLRTLAPRTACRRGTAAGDDMIGMEPWQAGPGQVRSLTRAPRFAAKPIPEAAPKPAISAYRLCDLGTSRTGPT